MDNHGNIKNILKILPHRYPFLFIDRILELNTEQGKITCLKNITMDEQFFTGHFPGNPIMPGVITLETMAQASILLFAALKPEIAGKNPEYLFGKTEVKFFKTVVPGDQLIIEVTKEKILGRGGIVLAIAKVKEDVIARAQIAFGVKINE